MLHGQEATPPPPLAHPLKHARTGLDRDVCTVPELLRVRPALPAYHVRVAHIGMGHPGVLVWCALAGPRRGVEVIVADELAFVPGD